MEILKLAIILFLLAPNFSYSVEIENTTYFGDLDLLLPKISQENRDINIAIANPIRDQAYCKKMLCVDGVAESAYGLVYFLMNNKTYIYDREQKSLIEDKLKISYNRSDGLGTMYLNYKNWNGVAYSSPGGEKVEIKQKDIKKHFYGRPFEYKIVNNFMWLHVKFEARPEHKCIPPFEKSSYTNPLKDVKVSQTVWIPYYQPVEHTTSMPEFYFENDSFKDRWFCPYEG